VGEKGEKWIVVEVLGKGGLVLLAAMVMGGGLPRPVFMWEILCFLKRLTLLFFTIEMNLLEK
jgi:hypothetical protein